MILGVELARKLFADETGFYAAVVKNPLSPVEHKGGEGVKNELFELGLDQFIRGLM